jgi:hypothetical protein
MDGLTATLLKDIVIGDVHLLFMRIMSLGQTNTAAAATVRGLQLQMSSMQKGTGSWTIYYEKFINIHDAMTAAGINPTDDYLKGCLINGLALDKRYDL